VNERVFHAEQSAGTEAGGVDDQVYWTEEGVRLVERGQTVSQDGHTTGFERGREVGEVAWRVEGVGSEADGVIPVLRDLGGGEDAILVDQLDSVFPLD
jgi:hypothetical protein